MTDLAIVFGSVFMLICIAIFLLHSSYIGRVTLLDWSVLGIGYLRRGLGAGGLRHPGRREFILGKMVAPF